ncbi:MAG TPA: copper amine oxidase N-terminal domain-containing protein [Epulopiscium sp.]|nr:copper amine oxidase N-terminal domain-containing protein [Candidatus Epulonipiscium sp.]
MSQSIKNKLMALMVVGVMAIPMVSFAQEKQPLISANEGVVISEKAEMKNEYIKYAGEISEVMEYEGDISIHVNSRDDQDEYGFVFHISEDVLLWNRETQKRVTSKDLKEGMAVEVYFNQNTPTTMSLPPQLTPAVVVIQKEAIGEPTYVGRFDKDLVSADHFLQLNIGKDTVIVNEKGEKLKIEDIYNKTVLVFFDMSTKSIPAQTTPSKIILLAEKEEAAEEIVEEAVEETIQEEETVEVEEVKEMIALRTTATELGYKVKWNEDKTVELTKQNQTIVIGIGKVDYTLNKSLGKFSEAPELRNDTMYVSASVLDFMN